MSKFSSFKNFQLITESFRKFLKEDEGDITYSIIDYFQGDETDVRNAAEITLPTGENISFMKVVEFLEGRTLSDEDEGDFEFRLENWRQHPDDEPEDIALEILSSGAGPFHIAEYAKLNGLTASDTGGWPD